MLGFYVYLTNVLLRLLGRMACTQCVCGRLMHVVRSVVSACVSLCLARARAVKMAELIEMPFGGQNCVGPRNLVLYASPRSDYKKGSFEGVIICWPLTT